ncbi:hypothetical protein BC829DRAFT_73194 [Chytridium lagenaria]|nr:hypothetical protein BC829DRAFT_73194 [Chytridium lagenaria]
MLVGVVGPVCAGKHTLACHLVTHHSFKQIIITPSTSDQDSPNGFKTNNTDPQPCLTFSSPHQALEYATSNWLQNFVFILPVHDPSFIMEEFRRRPFFLLVGVEAPTLMRFDRWMERRGGDRLALLEEFLKTDEGKKKLEEAIANMSIGYVPSPPDTPQIAMSRASTPPRNVSDVDDNIGPVEALINVDPTSREPDVRLQNHSPTLSQFHTNLHPLIPHLLNPTRLRPDWDTYFLRLCDLASTRSNCMKRRVGCILAKDKRVLATGYNGTPRGVRNCGEGGVQGVMVGQTGKGVGGVLVFACGGECAIGGGRERIANGGETVLYCNTCPCIGCAKKIVQAGVKKVVYSLTYHMDDLTRALFEEAGVEMRQHHDVSKVVVVK